MKQLMDRISKSLSCDCYKCAGQEFEWDQETGRKRVVNNMEHHTYLEPCSKCGRPKTEYKDLGRKGRYVCWWCRRRTADGSVGRLD